MCSQFQKAAAATTRDANADRGQHIDGKKSGQNHRLSTVLPVYLTEDNLTLAVLSLLLGGWLVVVVTFPIVSCSFFFFPPQYPSAAAEAGIQTWFQSLVFLIFFKY